MFAFVEVDNLVIVTYRPGEGDLFESFLAGFSDINVAYRCDFLLDLRGLTGPLDLLSNEELGRKWAGLARGRDVGRRTAIASADEPIHAQLEAFRAIYPYRKIDFFKDYDSAMAWVTGIVDPDERDVQLI